MWADRMPADYPFLKKLIINENKSFFIRNFYFYDFFLLEYSISLLYLWAYEGKGFKVN